MFINLNGECSETMSIQSSCFLANISRKCVLKELFEKQKKLREKEGHTALVPDINFLNPLTDVLICEPCLPLINIVGGK